MAQMAFNWSGQDSQGNVRSGSGVVTVGTPTLDNNRLPAQVPFSVTA